MLIHSEECSDLELGKLEHELRIIGFRLREVSSEKELRSMEYLKRPHSGNAQSFAGEKRWTVVRRKD